MEGAKREYPVAQVSLISSIVFIVTTIAFITTIVVFNVNIMVIMVTIIAFIVSIVVFNVTIFDNSEEQHHHDQFCSVDRWHRFPHNPLDRTNSCSLPGAEADVNVANDVDADADADINALWGS